MPNKLGCVLATVSLVCPYSLAEDPVFFESSALQARAEAELGLTDPTPTDMLGLQSLRCIFQQVCSIEGLQYASNLKELILSDNYIDDIAVLSGLIHLEKLVLNQNRIESISVVSGLSKLRHLDVHHNRLRTLSPVAGLTNLEVLIARENLLGDIGPVASLTNLKNLILSQNAIDDIGPIAHLHQLEGLWLQGSLVEDITPLLELDNLGTLDLTSAHLNQQAYRRDLNSIVKKNPSMCLRYSPNTPAPELLSPDIVTDSIGRPVGIQLSWISVPNGPNYTSYYRVYHSPTRNGKKIPASDWQTECAFMDKTIQPGDAFYYRLQTAVSANGEKAGSYSTPKLITMPNPPALAITSSAGGSVPQPGEGFFEFDRGDLVTVYAESMDPNRFLFQEWTGTALEADQGIDAKAALIQVAVDQFYTLHARFQAHANLIYVDDDAPLALESDNSVGQVLYEDGSIDFPFDCIQEAIEVVRSNATIVVREGTYFETIDLMGKGIHLTGFDPSASGMAAFPTIDANQAGTTVTFDQVEDANCVLSGFILTGGYDRIGAIACLNSHPTIRNCLIVGNRCTDVNSGVIFCKESNVVFENCTISGNYSDGDGATFYFSNSHAAITDSIIWSNGYTHIKVASGDDPIILYTDIGGHWPGAGNIAVYPGFAQQGIWVARNNPSVCLHPSNVSAVWTGGDYHLRSENGRWDPTTGKWILDDQFSPCLDAGDPVRPVGLEPEPHGGRRNLGAYGGTLQASLSVK